MVPMLELFQANVASIYSPFTIQYIDCEQYKQLCVEKFNVTSYPHFRLIIDGENIDVVPWLQLAQNNTHYMALAMSEVDFSKNRSRCDDPNYVFQTAHNHSLALGYYRLVSGKPTICTIKSNNSRFDKLVTYSGKRISAIAKFDRNAQPAQTFQRMVHTLPEYSVEFRPRLENIKYRVGRAVDYATGQFCPLAQAKRDERHRKKREQEANISASKTSE